ncbi:MAG: hypothetical protein KJO76_00385 [Gammaproteobacteria bacterium]|nr:hypothetical protein [Gammaproteobacteria bacterium]NND36815.1 hypothetical protein [Gammaproteobacteria bacterium]
MQVSELLQNFGSLVRARPNPGSVPAPVSRPTRLDPNRGDLLVARRQLLRVLESFAEIDRLLNGRTNVSSGLPSARSNPALSLDLTSTAATLKSGGEINATPTSFSPFVPAWDGTSTASLTIDGAYDGSNGTGAISFEVRQAGTHGLDRLRIRVRDPLGNIIDTVAIEQNDPLDLQYDLSNGLSFTLGAGSLVRFEATSIQVFDSVGSVVDIDKPLNGTGNDKANLQFGMPGVVDGSFQLNGVTIPVAASNSLNDILDVINQSAAGVSGSFDTATERLELTQNTPGSGPAIDIQGDDSNFVVATKLDTADVVPGIDPDTGQPMESLPQFSGVMSGSVVINGTSVAIDPQSDSLDDFINRINASSAGAVASFDTDAKQVVITGENSDDDLVIDANGTGIFGALNMPEGRLDRLARGRGYSGGQARRIANAVESSFAALNDFFRETKPLGKENPQIESLRSELKRAFRNVLGLNEESGDSVFGIDFNLDRISKRYIDFAYVDRGELIRGLRRRGGSVKAFLSGSKQGSGLVQVVGDSAQRTLLSLNSALGTKGTLFDTYA